MQRDTPDGLVRQPDNKMIMAIITIQLNFSMMKTTLFLFLILSSPLFMVKQTQ